MKFSPPSVPPPVITGTPVPYPNIGRVASNAAVLQFDEADALFGKRTKVRP